MAEINYIDANSIGNMVRAIKVKTDMTYATKDELSEVSNKVNQAGSTADRPATASIGQCYFDTNLNKPIWFNGTDWVDYTGAVV
jgi:hypothetical protein